MPVSIYRITPSLDSQSDSSDSIWTKDLFFIPTLSVMAKRFVLPAPFGRLQLEKYDPPGPGPSQIQKIKKNLFIPSFSHVIGMDIVGHVIDPGESQRFQKGDLIMSTGAVGYSDGCSYQSHALVQVVNCCKSAEDNKTNHASRSNLRYRCLDYLPFHSVSVRLDRLESGSVHKKLVTYVT
ncbi:hypothetical protein HZ326_21734 [Fusarium oxysporum f. sp. albedinis]|nr:hypothetical protein HZ326_21734 [Fusarium oxysporum f. sp. albedinis]